jgi:hypothetical protein
MKKIDITERLLSLFLTGDTTPDETYAILKAAKTDPEIALFLDVAEADGFFSFIIQSNHSARPVCQLFAIHSRHLPVMRAAASSKTNDCVVKCEAFVLNLFGKDSQYKRLYREARHHDWLRKEGTPLYNIGRLLELAQLSVSRRFGGTLDEMQSELNGNCSIIVALNAGRLENPQSRSSAVCDHAVVVTEINQDEGYVELYDPQNGNQADRYPVGTFLRAWKPSKNFFVSIIERGVRPYAPHPEYVAHIKLPEDILPIADMLAENAHEIWAKGRLAEAEEKKAKGEAVNPYDDPFMKPFHELTKQQRKTDYTSALNTIKLLYKLGFSITKDETSGFKFQSNKRDSEGNYVPNPINVDDVVLPEKIAEITEYIAENTHEEWAKQRFREGWTFAPKTNKKLKQSFDLVPYCELIDSEKEYDRKMAMNTLRVLYKLGYKIELIKAITFP